MAVNRQLAARRAARALVACVFACAALVGLARAAGAQVAQHERVAEALAVVETWLDAQLAYERIPSLSAAIVHDQALVWSGALGHAHPDGRVAATTETLYSICSISKLFTSIAVMQLRDEGALDLSDPVADHLPWFAVQQPYERSAPVTIEAMLTHAAGLPRESDHPYWTGPAFPFPTRYEIQERLSNQASLYPSWQYFQYSNLGMALAGEIVAERAGSTYDRYVRDRILGPLGMDDTHPEIPLEHRGARMATGYGSLNRRGERDEVAFFQTHGIAPAAGFASTAEDLARFASWQFRLIADGRRDEVLRGHTLQEMHRVRYVDPGWNTHRGLGFAVTRHKDQTFVGHGGSCPGFRADFLLQPAEKVATIFIANAMVNAGKFTRGMYDLVAAAIREAAEEPSDANDDAPVAADSGGGGAAAGADPVDLTPYLGAYDVQPWGGETAAVRWEGGLALLNLPTDDPVRALTRLEHEEGDVFRWRRPDGEPGDAIRFERDAEGQVTGYRRHGFVARRIR